MATHEPAQASSSSARPRVERVESLIPVEDYELRLALIESIRAALQPFRGPGKPDLTGLEFSYLINMPLDKLRNLKPLLPDLSGTLEPLINKLGNAAYKIEFPERSQGNSSAKTVSVKGKAPQRVTPQGSVTKPGSPNKSNADGKRSASEENTLLKAIANPSEASSVATNKGTEAGRSEALRKECLELDGNYCAVTGTSDPHVCHIVPFAWSKHEENFEVTKRLMPALQLVIDIQPPELKLEAMGKLQEGVGCTDRLWNMVCLSPQLHKWWDHAYFGLKYYGRNDSEEEGFVEIHLQFVWMPRNISQLAAQQIDLDQQADRSTGLSANLSHYYGGQTNTSCTESCSDCEATRRVKAYDSTGRPIVNGQIIVVKRREEDAPLFEAMIKIQWAVIRAAAISGGALAPGEFRSFSEDSDGEEADSPTAVEEEDLLSTAERIRDWLDHT
ncbi:uncharacterized protein FTJAE_13803 [Fusarium tjaetaba]|uniref:HNH nuclease domain-containing protein n=1 Tax=Fusarium tjaetaba TaxID=1567544 RepID=A0A8H5QGD8_9HYPO|nr:uncharacterized protein FTJAE_13803 [Fusarium tjaetaba]KAF5614047.1 hypothetical protein FTJAE_13803 [Fusarium tjaetaba]